jgi:CRP/FNR family transcriptional activator FtrB
MTRESFSRALASLELAGLKVDGQIVTILDRARLIAVAQPDPLIDPDARDDAFENGRRRRFLMLQETGLSPNRF